MQSKPPFGGCAGRLLYAFRGSFLSCRPRTKFPANVGKFNTIFFLFSGAMEDVMQNNQL